MAQLTYSVDMPIAFAGLLADNATRKDTLSRSSEEATSFPHGVAVVAGTEGGGEIRILCEDR